MFGFVCVKVFFIWKHSDSLLTMEQFSVLFTTDVSSFPGTLLVVGEVAEVINCLAIYF